MKKKLPREVKEFFSRAGKKGGRARAKKYDKKTLRRWARKGGRARVYPRCPRYGAHRFNARGRCPCGYSRAKGAATR